jgi:hypothetical protein
MMSDRDHTLFLLDGMALAYRAHFALANNPIRTASGRNTSAVYGFTNTLLDLINRFAPTHLAVVFDTDAPTARHREFEAYKAQRTAMPEELSQALPDIKRLIRAFNFPVIELDGYEADDLIGTLARKAEPSGFTTYMVTPDKDFGQLVSEHIAHGRQSRDARRGGGTGEMGNRTGGSGARHPRFFRRRLGQHPRRSRRGAEDRAQARCAIRHAGKRARPCRRAEGQAGRVAGEIPRAGAALEAAGHHRHGRAYPV